MYTEDYNVLDTHGMNVNESYRNSSIFRNTEQDSVYKRAADEQLFEEFSEKSA